MTVKHSDQLRYVAREGMREAQKNSKARQHHTALDIADERDTRRTLFGNLTLSKTASGSDLAEMCSENLAFFGCLPHHEHIFHA